MNLSRKIETFLIDSIMQDSLCVLDDLFDTATLENLAAICSAKHHADALRPAKIGRGLRQSKNPEIRNDLIEWISNWSETESLNGIHQTLQKLLVLFRTELRVPLKRFEAHFAAYPVGGFYKKHIDQHRITKHRQLSLVLYLNTLTLEDGGELVIYPKGRDPHVIRPTQGRLVIFQSANLIHEVRKTKALRLSLTGWFRDDALLPLS